MGSALLIAVALTGMKLFPLYNEFFKVRGALKSVASQQNLSEQSLADLRKLLLRNFEVQDVDLDPNDVKKYTRLEKVKGSGERLFRIEYEKRGPLFGNLDAVLKINESISVGGQ
jgi:hypothetical protein